MGSKTLPKVLSFTASGLKRIHAAGGLITSDNIESRLEVERGTQGIRGEVARGLGKTIEIARELELIERVNFSKLPRLLDDDRDDALFKADMIRELNSRLAARSPFMEELEQMARACFDRGVPRDRAIAFFGCKEILKILIDKLLNLEHSRFRSENPAAVASSILVAIAESLDFTSEELKKEPLTEEVEAKIMRAIKYFRDTYNPRSKKRTVYNFVEKIKEKYGKKYRVKKWLKDHNQLLVDIVNGGQEKEYEKEDSVINGEHVKEMINSAYQERAIQNPEEYIQLELNNVTEEYISLKDGRPVIYEEKIVRFFLQTLPLIVSEEYSLGDLREIFIKIIKNKIGHNDFYVSKNGTSPKRKENSSLDKYLDETLKIFNPRIDIHNLSNHPDTTPTEIRDLKDQLFDAEGKLKEADYAHHLKRLFGFIEDEPEASAPSPDVSLEEYTTKLFTDANDYLDDLSLTLNIPTIATSDLVRSTNDYASLIKIACDENSSEIERFEANRKIDIALHIGQIAKKPRRVYLDEDAKAAEVFLENDSLIAEREKSLKKINFTDTPEEQKVADEAGDTNSIDLIPANFAGVECGLLPSKDGKYMDKKSWKSVLTKVLLDKVPPELEITDNLRMTIVVDSIEKLQKVMTHLNEKYVSSGRGLRIENRYGSEVVIETTPIVESSIKSPAYRTARFVVLFPVRDPELKRSYDATIEIRALLTEDLVKEKSKHHHASHKKYEQRRARNTIRLLAPPKIYPDFYKKVGPNPDDIFERVKIQLKHQDDFKQAA